MSHRFRFLVEKVEGTTAAIRGDELFHLKKVLRLIVGTAVEVFDGNGGVGVGEIVAISSSEAEVALKEAITYPRPESSLAIGIGALKPKVFDELLPGLCEVGIDAIHVFLQPGVPGFRVNDSKIYSRWEKIMLNASKQCKRSYLPIISTYHTLGGLFETHPHWDNKFILSEVEGGPILDSSYASGSCLFLVGGEKGFSKEETDLASDHSLVPVSLGKNILRAKTAAVVAGGIMSAKRDKILP